MTTQAQRAADFVAPVQEPRKTLPVLWWAALGAGFVVFALYVHGRWILEDAHHVDTGVTPVPTYAKVSVRIHEVVFGLGILACLWFGLIRPKIKTGRVSFNGLLFLAFCFVWWQDPLYNYVTTGFTYNSYFVNAGGWGDNIPGWGSPNGSDFAEPLIWDFGFYAFLSFAGCLGCAHVLRKCKARWPQLSDGVMWVLFFFVMCVADIILEGTWVLTGLYSYAGTHNEWTVFDGSHYRFPIYEVALAASLFVMWTMFLYYRDDKGRTVVERGIEQVRVGHKGKQTLRFLALAGMVNLIFLVGNNVWVNAWQHHIDQWPKSLQERSYMTHDMCGAGTTYPCGGTNTSIPRGGKEIHVGPDGQLVIPEGAVIPEPVPHER